MKKTSKVFGAVALSAALALGTAIPAFALEEDVAAVNGEKNTSESSKVASQVIKNKEAGTSDVLMTTYTSNINVAVPIQITVAANIDGGLALTPKTAEIRNYSATGIKITKVAATSESATKWKLVANTTTNLDGTKTASDDAAYWMTLSGATLTKDGDTITDNAKDTTTQEVDLFTGADITVSTDAAYQKASLKNWGCAKSSDGTAPEIFPIHIDCSTSEVSNPDTYISTPTKVASVAFTVAAGAKWDGTAA